MKLRWVIWWCFASIVLAFAILGLANRAHDTGDAKAMDDGLLMGLGVVAGGVMAIWAILNRVLGKDD